MAKGTQAGRLSGPGAAGGAGPGTTNTTAAEKAENAVVAEGAAPAAPEGSSQFDATHVTGEGSSLPLGGEMVPQEGVLRPGVLQTDPPDWLAIARAAGRGAIEGTVEEIAGEPGPGTVVSGFVMTHLRIASRSPAGFRRCGRRWGPEPVEVDADEFTEADILRLLDEPELIVAAVTGGLLPVVE
ncbi:hypothetical protein SAMN05421829_108161 [Aromatoleum tolulyticum]|uniref:Mu-like prophage FluMu N-terminal domain-containing protein n=1 Tax=Aromatoleum tolulyticum TaxID=34027 RepID=A0A1N6X1Y8_9RHOO|nr:hypothetical protein [Aromatoleum tolulyticum]SIQ96358.1 hypothetical protein SAMN05421829_108161 [Aromatoleum tolulyticum]